MPDSLTIERTLTMRALGATVHLIDGGMEQARDWVLAQVRDTAGRPDAFLMLNQFDNPDNARAHYETTGPEVWRDTGGTVTHFVSAMGTTGTIMGVSRALKERNAAVRTPVEHADYTALVITPKYQLLSHAGNTEQLAFFYFIRC